MHRAAVVAMVVLLSACGPAVSSSGAGDGSGSSSGGSTTSVPQTTSTGGDSGTDDSGTPGASSGETSSGTGGPQLCASMWPIPELGDQNDWWRIGDVDGDGVSETWRLVEGVDGGLVLQGYEISFGRPAEPLVGWEAGTSGFLLGDVNADGHDDAVLRDEEWSWIAGTSDGLSMDASLIDARSVFEQEAAGDLDLDGDLDAVAVQGGEVVVLEGDGAGGFAVVAGGPHWYDIVHWVGVGRARQIWTLTRPECLGFCGDGMRFSEFAWTDTGLELISSAQPVLRNDGPGSRFVAATEPRSSGAPDVLMVVNGALEVWSGGPQNLAREVLRSGVQSAGAADFDGDGHVDGLALGEDGEVVALWGTEAGFAPAQPVLDATVVLVASRIADADAPGDAMLVRTPDGVSVLRLGDC